MDPSVYRNEKVFILMPWFYICVVFIYRGVCVCVNCLLINRGKGVLSFSQDWKWVLPQITQLGGSRIRPRCRSPQF